MTVSYRVSKFKKEDRETETKHLKDIFRASTDKTVFTVLRGGSGSAYYISPIVMRRDKYSKTIQPLSLSYAFACVLGYPFVVYNGMNAVKITGGGEDMGFRLVYNLSAKLYGYENKKAYTLQQRWL